MHPPLFRKALCHFLQRAFGLIRGYQAHAQEVTGRDLDRELATSGAAALAKTGAKRDPSRGAVNFGDLHAELLTQGQFFFKGSSLWRQAHKGLDWLRKLNLKEDAIVEKIKNR
jgi:hypothetical protein